MTDPLHLVEALPKRVRSVACWSNEGLGKAGAGTFNLKRVDRIPSTSSVLFKASSGGFQVHGHKNRALLRLEWSRLRVVIAFACCDLARVPTE